MQYCMTKQIPFWTNRKLQRVLITSSRRLKGIRRRRHVSQAVEFLSFMVETIRLYFLTVYMHT